MWKTNSTFNRELLMPAMIRPAALTLILCVGVVPFDATLAVENRGSDRG